MMCGCGQDASTTHVCPLPQGPTCWCGKPVWQTHVHWTPKPSTTWPATPYVTPVYPPYDQLVVLPFTEAL
jgi:hypothetical protein